MAVLLARLPSQLWGFQQRRAGVGFGACLPPPAPATPFLTPLRGPYGPVSREERECAVCNLEIIHTCVGLASAL